MICQNCVGLLALVLSTAGGPATTVDCAHPQALIEDVNIVNVVRGTITAHQDVLIADGKIALIAERDRIPKPGIPNRVYAGGKYLIPGLWDSYVLLSHPEEQLRLFVAQGVTGVRELSNSGASIKKWQIAAQLGTMLAPRIVAAGVSGDTGANSFGPGEQCRMREDDIPMLSQLRRSLFLDWSDQIHNPALQFVSAGIRAGWTNDLPSSPQLAAEVVAAHWRIYSAAEEMVRNRDKAGLPVLAGTCTGESFTVPGDELHRELELLVRAGLSPAAALRSATIEPVRKLHLDRQLGSVETGKEADLVLLAANPLDDIRNTRSIEAVFLKGRYLDRSQLDLLLLGTVRLARN